VPPRRASSPTAGVIGHGWRGYLEAIDLLLV